MNSLLKKTIKNIAFLSLGCFFLWYSMKGQDLSRIWAEVKSANIFWLLMACLAGILSHVVRALRWQQALEPLGYTVGLKSSFIGVMIGYVMNFVFPRAGEVSRSVMIHRTDKVPVQTALGTIITERILDVVMLMCCTGLALILQFNIFSNLVQTGPLADKLGFILKNSSILMMGGGIFLILTALIVYYRKQIKRSGAYLKIKKIVEGFAEGIRSVLLVKNKPLFIFYTVLMWVFYFLLPYLAFKSYGPTSEMSVATGITITALGAISVAAPVQGGLGVFHFLVASALVLFGLTEEQGRSYAIIAHGVQMVLIFTLGAICFALVIIDENREKKRMSKKNG